MKLKIQKYIIKAESTIEDAAKGIEQNASGFIFLENAKSEIIGLVTDGDIRRSLIAGMSLNDLALECSTKKFKYVKPQDEYEKILKLFDEQIAFLPVLDQKRRLVKIIFRDTLAIKDEKPVYIRSRAPVRVSFGGGGSDLTHYFKNSTGAVFNATISIFSHALMKLRVDEKIIIHSEDLNLSITYENLHVAKNSNDEFELIRALIGCVEPEYGFEMYINSDFSLGSGLGGSSTLLVAILGCFNALRLDKWSKKEIAEIAYQAERITLGASGGWQDQYSSVFGGFNFIEFNSFQNNIEPLNISDDIIFELEESLLLFDTGIQHDSDSIHKNQKKSMQAKAVKSLVKENVQLCYDIKRLLLEGNFLEFGRALDKTWMLKKKFSTEISNEYFDRIYNLAKENGALGGKLLGAGGGGYFLFCVPPFSRSNIIDVMKKENLREHKFQFENRGLTTWLNRK